MDITVLSSPSLSFFHSLFLSVFFLPFLLSLLFSLAVQASTGYTHLHTHTHNQANKDLHLLEHSAPNPLKKAHIFTIRSILDHPNGFQLLNLKANEKDVLVCSVLHSKTA